MVEDKTRFNFVLVVSFLTDGIHWFIFIVLLEETLAMQSHRNADPLSCGGWGVVISNKMENMVWYGRSVFADSNWVGEMYVSGHKLVNIRITWQYMQRALFIRQTKNAIIWVVCFAEENSLYVSYDTFSSDQLKIITFRYFKLMET